MPPVDRRCGASVHAGIRVGQREPYDTGDLAFEDLFSAERSSPAILRERKKLTAILLREQRDRPVGEEDYCRQFDPVGDEVGTSVHLGFNSDTVRNELDFFDGDSARSDGNPGKEYGRCTWAPEKR